MQEKSQRNGALEQTGEFGNQEAPNRSMDVKHGQTANDMSPSGMANHDRSEQMMGSSYVERNQNSNYLPSKAASAQILSDSFRKKSPMRMSQSALYQDIHMTSITQ